MINSRIIWITGASSGIGEALAMRWAAPGTQLVLSGRNRNQLEIVAENCKKKGAEVLILVFDLVDSF